MLGFTFLSNLGMIRAKNKCKLYETIIATIKSTLMQI